MGYEVPEGVFREFLGLVGADSGRAVDGVADMLRRYYPDVDGDRLDALRDRIREEMGLGRGPPASSPGHQ